MNSKADTIVIGGGLAGMTAALRLSRGGNKVILVDHGLPDAKGNLGGFAKFSGAKFSLPPAGLGLLPAVSGSPHTLQEKIGEVWSLLGLTDYSAGTSLDFSLEETVCLPLGTVLRQYRSVLLSPSEMDTLLQRLTSALAECVQIVKGQAVKLMKRGTSWEVTVSDNNANKFAISTSTVFYAGGRHSSAILRAAGASTVSGKGLDLGMRIEFADSRALSNLRTLGPDAKLISGKCRTFCLNVPGSVYRYPYGNITIPGGVVAGKLETKANVGLLARVSDKAILGDVAKKCERSYMELLTYSDQWRTGPPPEDKNFLAQIYGGEISSQLQDFAAELERSRMLDWSVPYKIHLPLIDWHWDVFCHPGSHRTTLEGVFALGDSAGHARGLMQAALSGWIAAEEHLNANTN
ncbi:hypothetical protein J2X56_004070 [Herbaspirillum sp. 1173]|uniref:FAD-binding protein n=1 Tax=Herbaspirillum sp. 1173 TaxID=2817734 RepID=UPI00285AE372|nr:FAD-binding protein [Herbaspirillum sp. 1173]MDR6742042.1 hypothetical protein [Herbaspirillum sp. 1173]